LPRVLHDGLPAIRPRSCNRLAQPTFALCTVERTIMMKGGLLWLIGIPIPIIILLWLTGVLS